MYLDLLDGHIGLLRSIFGRSRFHLKSGFLCGSSIKKISSQRTTLKKRNWQGCSKCCFCDQDETIHHLFFTCPFAQIMWLIIFMTFNIPPPANVTNYNLFGNRLNGVGKKVK
jgi:hypothetical protein